MNWLPDMDLNHDKQIQSLLCYRYTIGQAGASMRVGHSPAPSSREREGGKSEDRNPRSERNPKSEIRIKRCTSTARKFRLVNFGVRISDFLWISAFGFRPLTLRGPATSTS